MRQKHRVCINVVDPAGEKETVLRGGVKTIPKRLLRLLFGQDIELLIITPGRSVSSVEIHEINEGRKENGQSQTAL